MVCCDVLRGFTLCGIILSYISMCIGLYFIIAKVIRRVFLQRRCACIRAHTHTHRHTNGCSICLCVQHLFQAPLQLCYIPCTEVTDGCVFRKTQRNYRTQVLLEAEAGTEDHIRKCHLKPSSRKSLTWVLNFLVKTS